MNFDTHLPLADTKKIKFLHFHEFWSFGLPPACTPFPGLPPTTFFTANKHVSQPTFLEPSLAADCRSHSLALWELALSQLNQSKHVCRHALSDVISTQSRLRTSSSRSEIVRSSVVQFQSICSSDSMTQPFIAEHWAFVDVFSSERLAMLFPCMLTGERWQKKARSRIPPNKKHLVSKKGSSLQIYTYNKY